MQTHLPIGYKMVEGEIHTDQEKADTVKKIYNEYMNGKSMLAIAKELKENGIPNANNKTSWTHGAVGKILQNEKFCGDACMQKTYTVDFLTKKKVKNDGYVRPYYIEDNHEAIIPKELFHQVQEEKLPRASLYKAAVTRKKNKEEKEKSKYSSKYILTDLMVCAEC